MRYALFTLGLLWSLTAFGADPLTDGLVGWWPMTEGSGTTIADASGNGNTGTLYNSPAWVTGYNGSNALSFTSSSSTYVEIADSASLNVTDTGSLLFWVNTTNFPSTVQGIICKGNTVVGGGMCYGSYWNTSYMSARIGTEIGALICTDGSNRTATNTWVYIGITWDSSGLIRLYMNGLLLGTRAGNNYGAAPDGYPLRFGANGNTDPDSYFDGAIGGVRIFNRELSANDVNFIYASEGGTTWHLPDTYLSAISKPQFSAGLPHLTYWGQGSGRMSSNAVVELAKDWGYCLSLSGYATPTVAANTGTPGTFDYGMAQLAATDSNYKLSVLVDRTLGSPIPDAFYCTNSAGEFLLNGSGERVVCPEGDLVGASDYWTSSADGWISSLQTINANCPISIFLNGGEYGVTDAAHGLAYWTQDPRVQSQTVVTDPFWFPTLDTIVNTDGMSWNHYGSISKARTVGYLTKGIMDNFPSRDLSIFYHTGYEIYRSWTNDTVRHQNWMDMDGNGWWSSYMNTNTDLPSFQLYYKDDGYFGSGGWTGGYNLLTKYLNGKGFGYTIGYTNNYDWISAGWSATDSSAGVLGPIDRYTGLLKCLYMAGMRGAVSGYFVVPNGPIGSLLGGPGFDAPFPVDSPPHWLQQMIQLSRVHGLFSYLQSFLDNGQILSGPQTHVMSRDQPAYEFTNHQALVLCRTLVRKHNDRDEWLITSWSGDTVDRDITVTVPTLGDVNLRAALTGNVYRATVATGPQLVDMLGRIPSERVSAANTLRVNSIKGR